jgi:hypothetical protein
MEEPRGLLATGLTSHNAQPGDPAKAVAAMIKITEVSNPPLRLQLGADCVASISAKLEQMKEELERWRELAESTAYTSEKSVR